MGVWKKYPQNLQHKLKFLAVILASYVTPFLGYLPLKSLVSFGGSRQKDSNCATILTGPATGLASCGATVDVRRVPGGRGTQGGVHEEFELIRDFF